MEPMSALSVAASVVQFVDFSSKLISGSRKLYESAYGQFEVHVDLHRITEKLSELSRELQRPQNTPLSTQSAQDLKPLCDDARRVAIELIEVLNSLKLDKERASRWESCLQALKSMWKEERIQELQRRIDGFRQQLTLSIVVILREEVYSSRSGVSGQLDSLVWMLQDHFKENRQWHTDLTKIIREQYKDDISYDATLFSRPNIAKYGLQEEANVFARHILRCLDYKEMLDRQERINDRHRETFEWIFRENTSWDSFAKWLSNPSQLYWITGKAGAGKSTLMKFLHDDPRTLKLLSKSGDPKIPVVHASFFFWNSGQEIQMSQHGLVRSLLRQMVDQCQDLIPSAFPDLWETFSLLGSPPRGAFSWTELLRMLLLLIKQIGSSQKIFFLIDGLDEYHGEKRELLDFLGKLLKMPNCKMCVSSRPWPIFEDAFDSRPSVQIHELTLPDMRLFVSTSFNQNAGYRALKGENPRYAANLTEDIAQKASGVFLWVSLVVKLLLGDLSNGNSISDLQKRLETLPPDLETFFQKILDSQEPAHRQHASQLFQIFRACEPRGTTSILTLAFAEENADFILDQPVQPLDSQQLYSKIDRMRRRLHSHCGGLLEVPKHNFSPSSQIQYLHRTVKDFFQKENTWQRITSITPPSFNLHLQLFLSHLMSLKTTKFEVEGHAGLLAEFMYHISAYRAAVMDTAVTALDQVNSMFTAWISHFRGTKWPHVKPHWTHVEELTPFTYLLIGPGSFLNFIVSCRFLWYLEAKVSDGVMLKQDKGLIPLLIDAAVRSWHKPSTNSTRELDVKIVRFLLEHGADPAEPFRRSTVSEFIKAQASKSALSIARSMRVEKEVLEVINDWEKKMQPEATISRKVVPKVQRVTTESKEVQPEVAKPVGVRDGAAESGGVQPGVTNPGQVLPEAAEPRISQPEVAKLKEMKLENTGYRQVLPKAAEPKTSRPQVAKPEGNSAGYRPVRPRPKRSSPDRSCCCF